MIDKLRQWSTRKRIAVAAGLVVVATVVGSCLGVFEKDGPTYTRVVGDICDNLAYEALEPYLGARTAADIEKIDVDPADGAGCRIQFAGKMTKSTVTITVMLMESADDAAREYSFYHRGLGSSDTWPMDLPVKDAAWGYNDLNARAGMVDGNMFSTVTIRESSAARSTLTSPSQSRTSSSH